MKLLLVALAAFCFVQIYSAQYTKDDSPDENTKAPGLGQAVDIGVGVQDELVGGRIVDVILAKLSPSIQKLLDCVAQFLEDIRESLTAFLDKLFEVVYQLLDQLQDAIYDIIELLLGFCPVTRAGYTEKTGGGASSPAPGYTTPAYTS